MQSPLMAALLQVGAATQATIDNATDQIRESLSGSNDNLQKIIDNNFEEFEARTSRIQEEHEVLKTHSYNQFVRGFDVQHTSSSSFFLFFSSGSNNVPVAALRRL